MHRGWKSPGCHNPVLWFPKGSLEKSPPAAPQPFCLLLQADLALPMPTLPFAPAKAELSAIPAPAASLRKFSTKRCSCFSAGAEVQQGNYLQALSCTLKTKGCVRTRVGKRIKNIY